MYYRVLPSEPDGKVKMMAVNITTEPNTTVGKPRMLFEEDHYEYSEPHRSYDVADDGGFLMLELGEQPSEKVTELRVVLNWFEELKRLVPADN